MDIPFYETYTRIKGELGLSEKNIKDIGLGFSHILLLIDWGENAFLKKMICHFIIYSELIYKLLLYYAYAYAFDIFLRFELVLHLNAQFFIIIIELNEYALSKSVYYISKSIFSSLFLIINIIYIHFFS